ncbi:hypothetical protein EV421DRAFT_1710642 [Armillaria borealis]|uniref:Uncharacterized protein n=1 Tax=Armillaria borealis TaxID=47425 RepID=A0AA39JLA9_9AGAR|nr:hypothetical protein EV421DRAFT_1710642 [Armillaria borealis]
MSKRGLVSPEEPRTQTTDKLVPWSLYLSLPLILLIHSVQLSTLAQFRTINYGMERRQLHVLLPVNSSTTASSGHPFSFIVNRLESRIPLNTKTLSYQARPALVSTLTLIHLDPQGLLASEPKRKFTV